ncbi:uncharacterized protein C9orf85 homolog isoform X2 [Oryctolagus cuniculus]|uniref:Chromosome 9 open reading frame 85 n=1 Tax=Oryctolagus cuniculus TaxID=9986 RepID=U3KP29_RABIT|nr:uncharacterized protein C9orf85 homolog isoform X2 [Oryctolagus cuniculus]
MSSQKGNVARSRPQKYQNMFSFKNDRFDKSAQTKLLLPGSPCSTYMVSALPLPADNSGLISQFNSNSLRINAKLHEGVCQRCKEVLEWRVKYSKYKPLSKPKKCVKCLQKTVKDSYHIMCRLCAYELEVCAKCGKKEDIVIPFNKEPEKSENIDSNLSSNCRGNCRRNEESDDDLDFDLDLDDTED